MKCTNPSIKKLINMYQFDLLPDEDKPKVEAHLLECDSCMQELYQLSPALEIFEKVPEKFTDAVKPKKTIFSKILEYVTELVIPEIVAWWRKPGVKVLIPATIVSLLIIIYILPTSQSYSDLAIFEKAPYQTLTFKGPIEFSPEQKLFEEAMICYEQDDYTGAINKLSTYVELEPDNIYGQYYLGVCLLLQEDIERSIEHLELALQLSRQQNNSLFLEKCYWYLGNAYLMNEEGKKALEMFRNVVELHEAKEENATEQIKKIKSIKK